MAKKIDLEHKGTLDIYGPKPPKKDDDGWIYGVVFAVFIIFLLSTCS